MVDLFFPHEIPREFQVPLMEKIYSVLENKSSLLVHAPTGSGKTAAAITPAITYAMKNEKEALTVFFLTSRQTQHKIVLDTLQKIKERHDLKISAVPIIGKKWMCSVDSVESLRSDEFLEYCKVMREDEKCEFYSNTRNSGKLSVKAKDVISKLKFLSPLITERINETCKKEKLCPYEISLGIAETANVIICDYNYIFRGSVNKTFFAKISKHLDSSIIIVDEGHNLPHRIRDQQTARLSSIILSRAITEARKFEFEDVIFLLTGIHDVIRQLGQGLNEGDERLVKQDDFVRLVNNVKTYDELVLQLELAAVNVREQQKRSYIGSIAVFLRSWLVGDVGHTRIVSFKKSSRGSFLMLANHCLDPSTTTRPIIEKVHSIILMSGTLTPTGMYKDLLGFKSDAIEEDLPSPFPEKNRLTLIVPKTSTKFTKRSEQMFRDIAEICSNITDSIGGCSAIFFPSYYLRDEVNNFFSVMSEKSVFLEQPGLSKDEKYALLDRFKKYDRQGAVLLGVAAGSFGEGIDLPGLLKCVIVVGIPLDRPNLETKELIAYYDKKFGKGWDYGYVLPAVTKTLQNAGRCIRTEKDRGVLVFLDERYSWPNYIRCFPNDWNLKISLKYLEKIGLFFNSDR